MLSPGPKTREGNFAVDTIEDWISRSPAAYSYKRRRVNFQVTFGREPANDKTNERTNEQTGKRERGTAGEDGGGGGGGDSSRVVVDGGDGKEAVLESFGEKALPV